ncbi:Hypothetical protein, putative [Bodo saltans]|uniref:Uncharacterized protein n=1 Tax=Bodo saltans TaxID=75058 RepID=A0A0S4JKU1_BODSA|nr:Hypothetical protein, putative [Bodo saltans]|eukprot:CUG90552.1 Hypothetical protein, putative [Bodo saltans]
MATFIGWRIRWRCRSSQHVVVSLNAPAGAFAAADVVTLVPCGVKSVYNSGFTSNTQFVVKNCSATITGTVLVIYASTIDAGTNLSTIVEHSLQT